MTKGRAHGGAAFLVGAGILFSRLAGLIRQKVFAHYFGASPVADAFNAAFRIPNLLQNLFGEGVLSASFIPEYSRLVARGDQRESDRLAGAVLAALALVAAILVLLGVLMAPMLVALIAPGFTGEKRELTTQLTRIFFPASGLLVFSAWCLGILNSHRRFFLSYAAPVVWNLTMVAAMLWFGRGATQQRLVVYLAWASVLGSAFMFALQLPVVLKLTGAIRPHLDFSSESSRGVIRNFLPAVMSRGVVQISAYVDSFIASWLPGAVAIIAYAQLLYTLPVSLFGMAVSAAEIPLMSAATGTPEEVASYLRGRLDGGLHRIAYFIIPSAVAFFALGDVVGGALYESGRFSRSDSIWMWQVLAGSTIGLLASTWGRLYSSTFYAMRDTRTPLYYAAIRVSVASTLGYVSALYLPRWLGVDPRYGAAFLTAASGAAGWLEFLLLRREMKRRIGHTSIRRAHTFRLWFAALSAAAIAWGFKLGLESTHTVWTALAILASYGVAYLLLTTLFQVPEAVALTARLTRRR